MIDMVDKLLAAAGEATLLVSLMRLGILQHGPDTGFPCVGIREDENHLAVIYIGAGNNEFPQRLVLDGDFGWLWYNAEGPTDDPA